MRTTLRDWTIVVLRYQTISCVHTWIECVCHIDDLWWIVSLDDYWWFMIEGGPKGLQYFTLHFIDMWFLIIPNWVVLVLVESRVHMTDQVIIEVAIENNNKQCG